MFNPPMGGQRQAYTQVATEIASHGRIVLTFDHSFLSGAVEVNENIVAFNLAHEIIHAAEAINTYILDMTAVKDHLTERNGTFTSWSEMLEVKIDFNRTCVLGHGSGGLAALVMKAKNIVTCGNKLSDWMPAPYTANDVFFTPPLNHTRKPIGNEWGFEDTLEGTRDAPSDSG